MILWIVDDDIYFASRFKDQILSAPVFGSDKPKVELFHDGASFLESLERIKKDASKKPALIFLDVELPDSKGPLLFLDLLEEGNPLTSQIHFVSSMSYGRFRDFFEARGLESPPFTPKGSIDAKLEEMLLPLMNAISGEEGHKSWPLPYPLAAQVIEDLKKTIAFLRDSYYDSGFKGGKNRELTSQIGRIGELAGRLDIREISGRTDHLLSLLNQKRPPAMTKLKKEMRDLFKMAEKMLETG